jgi:hypothetical protein
MHAIKLVKNGTASVKIPKEFGEKVEIIILPAGSDDQKKKASTEKTLLDIIGKAKISDDIFTELENGRKETRL